MSSGSKSTEFRVSAAAGVAVGGVVIVPVLIDMMRDKTLPEAVQVALVWAVALIISSYNLSRGLAKYEGRGVVKDDHDGRPPSA